MARTQLTALEAGQRLVGAATPVATDGRTTVHSGSPEETRSLGAALAAVAQAGDRIALLGDLGAGKTQFVKGLAVGLGITDVVNSPSFTLMAEYEGRLPLFHIDLYRLDGATSALAGGLLDERQADGVTLSEWADRLGDSLDQDRLEIRIAIEGDDQRTIELQAHDDRYGPYLRAAAEWATRRQDGDR
jgi:tRNA threonylcarbamoyladenosine biosynthesis protein TsaE